MAAFDAQVQAIAKETLLPKAVDTVLNSNVLTARMLTNSKTWTGTKLERPVIVGTAGNGGSFFGLDQHSTNSADTKQKLSFDLRAYEQPVALAQLEVDAVQSSPQRAVDMVTEAIQEAANEMADSLGTIFYADGTGNSNKDFLGLAANIDDGGEVATFGGLSRTTYSTLRSTENDLGGPLTLAAMATGYSGARSGNNKPTIVLTTEAIWNSYEALNQPTTQNSQQGFRQVTRSGIMGQNMNGSEGLVGERGFDALFYRGVPIVADEKATSGVMWFINEEWLAFYRLKSTMEGYSNISLGGNTQIDGIYSEKFANAGFDWSGFREPIDQYGKVGHIYLFGNLVSFNPKRHAVINTIS
jgi:hypothetical protein